MKIHVLSDVHLEFQRWRRQWDISTIECDVHVLAGDIGVGMSGLEFALQKFSRPTIYVAGNHEFYCRRAVPEWWRDARHKVAGTHVHLLENESIVINGVRFLGTTLWTDFTLHGRERQELTGRECEKRINDFAHIFLGRSNAKSISTLDPIEPRRQGRGGNRLTWRKVAEWHQIAREFLESELPQTGNWNRTIVVTHHSPSKCAREYSSYTNAIDAAYANHLDHLIPLTDCWMHGHTHRANEYSGKQGGRVVRNARGYADTGWDAVEGFQWNRVISLV